MEKWYVKNTAGKVFGPIDLEMLKMWVKDGRVEPLAGISNDLQSWMLAPLKPELEMNWVVENNPGQFYGPTHRVVLDDLLKAGTLSHEARFYQDDRGEGLERLRALAAAISEKDSEISRRDKALGEAQKLSAKKDLQIAAAQKAINQRDERVAEATSLLAQRDSQVDSLSKALQNKEGELARMNAELARKQSELEKALQEVKRRDAEIAEMKEAQERANAIHQREWKTDVVEPEVIVAEMPPPVARQAFGAQSRPAPGKAGGMSISRLAAMERQAQQELASIGITDIRQLLGKRK